MMTVIQILYLKPLLKHTPIQFAPFSNPPWAPEQTRIHMHDTHNSFCHSMLDTIWLALVMLAVCQVIAAIVFVSDVANSWSKVITVQFRIKEILFTVSNCSQCRAIIEWMCERSWWAGGTLQGSHCRYMNVCVNGWMSHSPVDWYLPFIFTFTLTRPKPEYLHLLHPSFPFVFFLFSKY